MSTYLRSLRAAQWIELVPAAIWLFAAVALAVISAVMGFGQAPPPGAVAPPLANRVLGTAPIFLVLGLFGGGPGLLVGWLLRRQRLAASRSLTAMVLAFVFAGLYLALILAGVLMTVSQPGGSAPIDVDFLVLGGLIALNGLAHLAAGSLVLWGRRALPRSPAPREDVGLRPAGTMRAA